jgi:hypothetical protein
MQMRAFGTAMQMVFREKIEETPQPHTHTRTEKKIRPRKVLPHGNWMVFVSVSALAWD